MHLLRESSLRLFVQYFGHTALDHVRSVHVALMNLFVADVEFVVVSLQSPDGRQASVLLQHMLIFAVESHGTSLLRSPLGKKQKSAAHVVEARHRTANLVGRARKTITRYRYHDATAVMTLKPAFDPSSPTVKEN